jgi:tetratricopeptide (TPR) repeat protein
MPDERTDHHPHGTLEAAWDALEAGDVATARRRASRLDATSPETLLLLAACCREEDDDAQAMQLLRRAAKADPEWATPELWLAEILATQPETTEEALGHAERALDLAEEESEYLSAVSLKAGLEAELGEVDEAKRTLGDLPPADVALGDGDLALEIADLHLALGDAQIARERLRTLTGAEPELADAWYALGCAASDLGDERETRDAWRWASCPSGRAPCCATCRWWWRRSRPRQTSTPGSTRGRSGCSAEPPTPTPRTWGASRD